MGGSSKVLGATGESAVPFLPGQATRESTDGAAVREPINVQSYRCD